MGRTTTVTKEIDWVEFKKTLTTSDYANLSAYNESLYDDSVYNESDYNESVSNEAVYNKSADNDSFLLTNESILSAQKAASLPPHYSLHMGFIIGGILSFVVVTSMVLVTIYRKNQSDAREFENAKQTTGQQMADTAEQQTTNPAEQQTSDTAEQQTTVNADTSSKSSESIDTLSEPIDEGKASTLPRSEDSGSQGSFPISETERRLRLQETEASSLGETSRRSSSGSSDTESESGSIDSSRRVSIISTLTLT